MDYENLIAVRCSGTTLNCSAHNARNDLASDEINTTSQRYQECTCVKEELTTSGDSVPVVYWGFVIAAHATLIIGAPVLSNVMRRNDAIHSAVEDVKKKKSVNADCNE